ncbi:MAG TPA: hypothetical protein VHY34_04495, partial [Caulobacteraceae bacterium]|nr:hypothetical protein [Caulobacteraceae bacterium]
MLLLEIVITGLEVRGVGGARTGIREAAGLTVRPCGCGALRFVTRPAFPATLGAPEARWPSADIPH